MAAEKRIQLAEQIRTFEHSLKTQSEYAHIWVFSQNPAANAFIWSSANAFFFGALAELKAIFFEDEDVVIRGIYQWPEISEADVTLFVELMGKTQ